MFNTLAVGKFSLTSNAGANGNLFNWLVSTAQDAGVAGWIKLFQALNLGDEAAIEFEVAEFGGTAPGSVSFTPHVGFATVQGYSPAEILPACISPVFSLANLAGNGRQVFMISNLKMAAQLLYINVDMPTFASGCKLQFTVRVNTKR